MTQFSGNLINVETFDKKIFEKLSQMMLQYQGGIPASFGGSYVAIFIFCKSRDVDMKILQTGIYWTWHFKSL